MRSKDQRRHGSEVHDPARGGVLQRLGRRRQLAVQPAFLGGVEQRAADGVYNALRHPRGAGRVHNQEGVAEGHLLKIRNGMSRGSLGEEGRKGLGLWDGTDVFGRGESRLGDDSDELGVIFHSGYDLGHLLAQIDCFAIVDCGVVHEDELCFSREH